MAKRIWLVEECNHFIGGGCGELMHNAFGTEEEAIVYFKSRVESYQNDNGEFYDTDCDTLDECIKRHEWGNGEDWIRYEKLGVQEGL